MSGPRHALRTRFRVRFQVHLALGFRERVRDAVGLGFSDSDVRDGHSDRECECVGETDGDLLHTRVRPVRGDNETRHAHGDGHPAAAVTIGPAFLAAVREPEPFRRADDDVS